MAKRKSEQVVSFWDENPPPVDYRETPAGQALMKGVEAILIMADRPVTGTYLLKRLTVPRGWSLMDVIAYSKHIVRHIAHPADLFTYTEDVTGPRVLYGYGDFQVTPRANRAWNGSYYA